MEFEKIQETDLEFILSIRNECKDFLHDNREFTLNECKEWFTKTNPLFYIIKYNNDKIGYFRTSNYSEQHKSIYIGCDLHKEWRGKKLAIPAYKEFMNMIFKQFNLKTIYLEVLGNNIRAYNLYKKLGFKEQKITDFIRNNENIKSILMSYTYEK